MKHTHMEDSSSERQPLRLQIGFKVIHIHTSLATQTAKASISKNEIT